VALDEDSQYEDVDEGADAEDESSPTLQRQLQLEQEEEDEEGEESEEDSESEVEAVVAEQEAPVGTEATPIATVSSVASPTQPAAADAASPADTITPVQKQLSEASPSPSLDGAGAQVERTPSSACAADDTSRAEDLQQSQPATEKRAHCVDPPQCVDDTPPPAAHAGDPIAPCTGGTPSSLAPLGTTEQGALCAETFLAETQVEATPTPSCTGAVDVADTPPATQKLTQCVPAPCSPDPRHRCLSHSHPFRTCSVVLNSQQRGCVRVAQGGADARGVQDRAEGVEGACA
jgi:hypothetical protein